MSGPEFDFDRHLVGQAWMRYRADRWRLTRPVLSHAGYCVKRFGIPGACCCHRSRTALLLSRLHRTAVARAA